MSRPENYEKLSKENDSEKEELEFFMDVSPRWWLKARKDKRFLKKYVYEKFESDYYPRTITRDRENVDLDKTGQQIKNSILEKLRLGSFDYEFLPEDERIKESYLISNGLVHFNPRKKRINARLLIKVRV